jgi:CheY-like chemotaxis protein
VPEWLLAPARGSQPRDGVNENRYILLVEDDPDLRDAVAEILTDEGFRVVRTADGREALAALKSGLDFCAILLDIRMPVMDGVEFRRHQLRDPDHAKVPVVAFSASSGEEAEVRALGIDTSIAKPVDLTALLRAVTGKCGTPTPPQRLEPVA